MLKKLAAIGLGAALVFAPVAGFAQTDPATPAPASTPMAKKMVHHKAHKAKHVVKKPMAHEMKKPMAHKTSHKMKKPMPAPTETPKS